MDTPWRTRDGGLLLRLRLTPKSSRDAIEGIDRLADGTLVLAARVRAVPESGRANAALIKLLARTLSIPKNSLSVTAGGRARIKTVTINGDATVLSRRLAAVIGDAKP
jgi:uncharacterized protein YggU (UPF0235/DUF167 family)